MADSYDPYHHQGAAVYSPLLEAAVRLAAAAHHFQLRRQGAADQGQTKDPVGLPAGSVPYVTHLTGTALILARLGARDEVLAAALLHDYLEDVPDPDGRQTIRETAGDTVLDLVLAVTENKRAELDAALTWEVRKAEQVAAISKMPAEAVLIKSADLLHNLISLASDLQAEEDVEQVWARFHAPPDRELWYFRSVVEAVRRRDGSNPLLNDLEKALAEVGRFVPEACEPGSGAD